MQRKAVSLHILGVLTPVTKFILSVITLGVHVPEGYSTWCVCVCVLCPAIPAPQATRRHISDTSGFRTMTYMGDFSKMAVFERYGVKKSLCIISTWAPL